MTKFQFQNIGTPPRVSKMESPFFKNMEPYNQGKFIITDTRQNMLVELLQHFHCIVYSRTQIKSTRMGILTVTKTSPWSFDFVIL